jgi:hypothetical protein
MFKYRLDFVDYSLPFCWLLIFTVEAHGGLSSWGPPWVLSHPAMVFGWGGLCSLVGTLG